MKELKPGNELDALVAEKVMGWKWHEMNPGSAMYPPGYSPSTPLNQIPPKVYYEGGFRVPQYSTDLVAAWSLVDHLRKRELATPAIWPPAIYAPGAVISPGEYNGTEWQVRMAVSRDRDSSIDWDAPGIIAFGETAPHAICLAALKASS